MERYVEVFLHPLKNGNKFLQNIDTLGRGCFPQLCRRDCIKPKNIVTKTATTLGSYNRCLEVLQSGIFFWPDFVGPHREKVSSNFLQEACGPAILSEILFCENGDWCQSVLMLPLHVLVFINLSNQLLMCGLMCSFIHISDIFQRKWHETWHFMSDFVQPSSHF